MSSKDNKKNFNAIDCNVNWFLYTMSLVLSSELAWQCIIQIAQTNLTTVSILSHIFIQNCISICLSELSFSVSIYLEVFQNWLFSGVLSQLLPLLLFQWLIQILLSALQNSITLFNSWSSHIFWSSYPKSRCWLIKITTVHACPVRCSTAELVYMPQLRRWVTEGICYINNCKPKVQQIMYTFQCLDFCIVN